MARVQFQFHVDPDEAQRLAETWANHIGADVVIEQNYPEYRAVPVKRDAIVSSAQTMKGVDRVALCRHSPVVTAGSPQEFAAANPDCLFLSIGRLTAEGLRESALGGLSTDADTLRTWRRLVRRARAEMHTDAVVENPASGASGRHAGHRYTPGARSLAEQGVAMLASAGWNHYLFDDVVDGGTSP